MIATEHSAAIEGTSERVEPYCGECHTFLSQAQLEDFMLDIESRIDVSDAWNDGAPKLWLCTGSSSVCECRARSVFVHAWNADGDTCAWGDGMDWEEEL